MKVGIPDEHVQHAFDILKSQKHALARAAYEFSEKQQKDKSFCQDPANWSLTRSSVAAPPLPHAWPLTDVSWAATSTPAAGCSR